MPPAEVAQLRLLWEEEGRGAWLRQTNSTHTRRSYRYASAAWIKFVAQQRDGAGGVVELWQVTSRHVRLWQECLAKGDPATGQKALGPTAINQRLAACSSWYSFMINERELSAEGYEISAFMDLAGRTRSNPFRGSNIKRAKTKRYAKARKLKPGETNKLLRYLEERRNTLLGARNYALILTYLMTGYRNVEVVSMQWGKIKPSTLEPDKWLYEWSGKGERSQLDPLPVKVYQAIVDSLQTGGRCLEEMGVEDYLFTPLVVHNLGNLAHQGAGSGVKHLSTTQAAKILATAVRKAGIKGKVRVHDLRHTFAVRFYEMERDIKATQERLHHKSLATTEIYVGEVLEEPVDNYSDQLYERLMGGSTPPREK